MRTRDELPVRDIVSMHSGADSGVSCTGREATPRAGLTPLIEVNDDDYRSFYLPCHAFEEDPERGDGH